MCESFPASPNTIRRVGNKLKQNQILESAHNKIGAYFDNVYYVPRN